MATPPLTLDQLEALKKYNTPTIANAIEIFNLRGRHLGFLPHRIRCLFPDLGPIVGYAVTSVTQASPPTEKGPDLNADYLRYVAAQPGPEDRRRPGPRRSARPGGAVRRGQRDDPPEARLRRPHHRRLPPRPRRGQGPRVSSSSGSTRASATPTSGWSTSASR